MVLLGVSILLVACADAGTESYAGRPIAGVMSWRAADWLERPERAEEEATDHLVAALPVEPGDTVLDLGCGTGFHARRLARRVGPGGRVICVDLQPEMLRRAEELAAEEGLNNVSFVVGEERRVPVDPSAADLVLLVDVYHELSDPAAMLASVRSTLAAEGKVAVVEFRLEGESAAGIAHDHRMDAEQVVKEWSAAGFVLAGRVDTLPSQHLLLFQAAPPPADAVAPVPSAPDGR